LILASARRIERLPQGDSRVARNQLKWLEPSHPPVRKSRRWRDKAGGPDQSIAHAGKSKQTGSRGGMRRCREGLNPGNTCPQPWREISREACASGVFERMKHASERLVVNATRQNWQRHPFHDVSQRNDSRLRLQQLDARGADAHVGLAASGAFGGKNKRAGIAQRGVQARLRNHMGILP
jgi:hypothetical protein